MTDAALRRSAEATRQSTGALCEVVAGAGASNLALWATHSLLPFNIGSLVSGEARVRGNVDLLMENDVLYATRLHRRGARVRSTHVRAILSAAKKRASESERSTHSTIEATRQPELH